MSKNISDDALQRAATKLAKARITAQPSLDECEHKFSPEFENAMDKLMQKRPCKVTLRRVVSIAASLLLVLLIGAGAVLSFYQEARASFVTWLREQYENSIIYRFWSGGDTSEFPTYQIGWLPDECELTQEITEEKLYIATYLTRDGEDTIVFMYFLSDDDDMITMWGDLNSKEPVTIQRWYGEYVPLENGRGGELVWINESEHLVFVLSAKLDKSTIIKIAESVFLEK